MAKRDPKDVLEGEIRQTFKNFDPKAFGQSPAPSWCSQTNAPHPIVVQLNKGGHALTMATWSGRKKGQRRPVAQQNTKMESGSILSYKKVFQNVTPGDPTQINVTTTDHIQMKFGGPVTYTEPDVTKGHALIRRAITCPTWHRREMMLREITTQNNICKLVYMTCGGSEIKVGAQTGPDRLTHARDESWHDS